MTRKQFLMLMLALLVLGGAGLALFWQDIAAYRSSGAKIGARLLPGLKLAEVARIELRDAAHTATLARQDDRWVVAERNGYPASFQDISDLLIKLVELKVVQSEAIGESLLPRVGLAPPPAKPAPDAKLTEETKDATGTRIEMKDAAGKTLAVVTLGKVVLKKDPGNPLPSAQNGVPAGRYVQVAEVQNVAVVSDPLSNVEADPGRWLDKSFYKVDRIRTLAVGGDAGVRWKIARDEEWGQWRFAAGAGALDASAAVGAVNALGNLAFTDVAIGAQPEGDRRVTVVAETFDRLTYTFRIAPHAGGDYLFQGSVEGEPPAQRTAEKDEKPEEKERRDKEYAATLKKLQERLAREQALSRWTYVVAAKTVEPLLKDKSGLAPASK